MAREFALPDIGSGLQEAEIVAWQVEVGDSVTADQVLCEVETEKSIVEIPVPFAGVVLALAGPPGTSVEVGALLVVIGEAGETVEDSGAVTAAPAEDALEGVRPGSAAPDPAPIVAAVRPAAMPLVRKLARDHEVDLGSIAGTGVGGRITRKDVEAAVSTPARSAPRGARSVERVRMSRLRRTIAGHMTGQWQAVPHISAHVEADASRLISARKSLSERLGTKVPIDALLVAMVIPALQQFPIANAEVDGDDLVVKHYCDVGIAVGSPDGLLVPILRDADRLGLAELVEKVADLTSRAKERNVAPEEMGDQTFTISNLGGLRGRHATQVIPARTTAIVSFGRAVEQPVVRNGEIVVAPVMAVSGTFDHRAMDGVEAMGVMNAIVDVIQEPALLLV